MASNCSNLDSYNGFVSYVRDLRRATSDNLTVSAMESCRSSICSTLYGVGNADVSGIGVFTAYILHLSLGVVLASLVLVVGMARGRWSATTAIRPADVATHSRTAVEKMYDKYAEAAVVLTFSVQIAALVLVVKKLFGISAVDFGSLTVEVTWAAALITILPLPLTYLVPSVALEKQKEEQTTSRPEGYDTDEARDLKIVGIILAWVLFFFTFTCRMANHYSSGQVGDGPGKVISEAEAQNIKELCFGRKSILSVSEELAFDFFALGGSLFVSVVILGIFIDAVGQRRQWLWSTEFRGSRVYAKADSVAGRAILIFNTLLWGVPQIWTIFRFRKIQSTLAQSIRMVDNDKTWSFGQIISAVVFLPVVVQGIYELGHSFASGNDPASGTVQDANSQKTV